MEGLDEIISKVIESRRAGGYTVINENEPQHSNPRRFGVAYLSKRDVDYEKRTGEDSIVRRNLERKGFEVLPYWEQLL
jgi:hypothetical protein